MSMSLMAGAILILEAMVCKRETVHRCGFRGADRDDGRLYYIQQQIIITGRLHHIQQQMIVTGNNKMQLRYLSCIFNGAPCGARY